MKPPVYKLGVLLCPIVSFNISLSIRLDKNIKMMNKYVNLKIIVESDSINIYAETGGEPVHIVYWTEDEWLEDATIVPSIANAIHLAHTDPDNLIERILNVNVPDPRESLFTQEELDQFKKDWGQEHLEICCCLGFDPDDDDSWEQIMIIDNYFWHEPDQLWLNKCASGFSGKDQIIADYLRYEL